MFGLPKHGPDGRYGAILDVGSGSAGVAIVASDPLEKNPVIIWSYRERMIIRDHSNLDATEKNITTTVVNAVLELGNTGMRALRDYDRQAKVDEVLVSISAPWSHTVSRTIATEDVDKPFVLDEKKLDALVKKAREAAAKETDEHTLSEKYDLAIISDETISVTANGYRINNPFVSEVQKVTLSQLVGVTQVRFYEAIYESLEKVMPDTTATFRTFMHLFYETLDAAHPETSEICLIDITSEATEVGIVRDNVLYQTTNTPQGIYSLARQISDTCNVPREEAMSFMREGGSKLDTTLSAEKQGKLLKILAGYEQEVAKLFSTTGDALSIPKTIFLHTDKHFERFLSARISAAAKLATNTEHAVHPITSDFFGDVKADDTALILSAHVFHNRLYDSKYLQT